MESDSDSVDRPPAEAHSIAAPVASRLACHGCRLEVPLDEIRPYRCREGEEHDDVDHVLRRRFDAEDVLQEATRQGSF